MGSHTYVPSGRKIGAPVVGGYVASLAHEASYQLEPRQTTISRQCARPLTTAAIHSS
jgi:hypothetical protein